MWQDVRQAARTLATHPGFVAMAALVLGLGIGLNTAIFSIVVYAMLFKPLPVADPGALVSIYWALPHQPDRPGVLPSTYYDFFRQQNDAFTDLTGHWGLPYTLRADNETVRVDAEWVMANYFDVLGVKPLLGRTFLPSEDELANPERAVVISHALWVRRFNADPQIVGKKITLGLWGRSDLLCTVIGVTGPEFKEISTPWKPTQLWITFAQGGGPVREGRIASSFAVIGRLQPGVSVARARAVVSTLGRQRYYSTRWGTPEHEPRFVVLRTNDVRMPFDPSAVLIPARLAGAMILVVGIVLLVAAANVAGILMARALGDDCRHIVRLVLAEDGRMALVGAVAGLALGYSSVRMASNRYLALPQLDALIVAMPLLLGAIILLACYLPARRAGRLDPIEVLRRS